MADTGSGRWRSKASCTGGSRSSSKAHSARGSFQAGGRVTDEASGGALDEDEIPDSAIDEFLEALFAEYAATKDNHGNPLMNNMACRRFFRDFTVGDTEAVIAAADRHYADEIERQVDLHHRYDMAKGEAKRGLCLKAFLVLLGLAMPRHVARRVARQHFVTYSGSAKAMREHLSASTRLTA